MSATSSMLIGGSIAIDNIKTPTAEANNLLGGSASYTAVAASYFAAPVHLLGIIGKDFPEEHVNMFESKNISTGGLERSDGETFSWSGSYHENMNDRDTLAVATNVLEDWHPKVPAAAAGSEIIVLANMHPMNQLQIIEQLTADAPFIAADTMDLWIAIANDDLNKVLKKTDLLVINESEARDFCKTSNLITAGKILMEKGPTFVIIKLGEFGSILFAKSEVKASTAFQLPGADYKIFRCPTFPLEQVTDPTGAGDSFLGALAGHLASLKKTTFTFEEMRDAVVNGSVVASFTCEEFSATRLAEISAKDIAERKQTLQRLTHWA